MNSNENLNGTDNSVMTTSIQENNQLNSGSVDTPQEVASQIEQDVVYNKGINTQVTEQTINYGIDTKNVKEKKSKLWIVILILSLIIVILIGLNVYKYIIKDLKYYDIDRSNTLKTISKNEYNSFKINENEFYIGESAKDFFDKGYTVDDIYVNPNFINEDSILTLTFSYEDTSVFAGTLYCPNLGGCTYEEAKIISIEFFPISNVEVMDGITFGMTYNNIKSKLGEISGRYRQHTGADVWTFGNNEIGDSYLIVNYNRNYFTNSSNLNKSTNIIFGVWWYKGQYDHIIEPLEEN